MFDILLTALYVMAALIVIMLVPLFAGGAMMLLMPGAYLTDVITFLLREIVENGKLIIELVKDQKTSSFVDAFKLSAFQVGYAVAVILCVPLCIISVLFALLVAFTPVVIATVYYWQEYITTGQDSSMENWLVAWSICYVLALVAFGVAMFRDKL